MRAKMQQTSRHVAFLPAAWFSFRAPRAARGVRPVLATGSSRGEVQCCADKRARKTLTARPFNSPNIDLSRTCDQKIEPCKK